jgi:hypothetical protein
MFSPLTLVRQRQNVRAADRQMKLPSESNNGGGTRAT